ncbi:hypothetical protein SAMD00019534_051050 [Acytostelium subglobosum LB1]|uniref:hypothetical protein n=1 Tax=Acytostelium subglobosum LB1 TaxID=1410327 RepID=UPI000644ED33|nr:hypothetical protein SAMD00019534_051050 [Acytostelium subglobosum LB1]GAM21930.1 hypothetical protein SAMD00019534_051050 [Acytostelium subglobosum LB1]|eukprot:XP_012755030.1 hypothetical protein SAMD00019534_051050 [Acytostelium subglobosum LB1]
MNLVNFVPVVPPVSKVKILSDGRVKITRELQIDNTTILEIPDVTAQIDLFSIKDQSQIAEPEVFRLNNNTSTTATHYIQVGDNVDLRLKDDKQITGKVLSISVDNGGASLTGIFGHTPPANAQQQACYVIADSHNEDLQIVVKQDSIVQYSFVKSSSSNRLPFNYVNPKSTYITVKGSSSRTVSVSYVVQTLSKFTIKHELVSKMIEAYLANINTMSEQDIPVPESSQTFPFNLKSFLFWENVHNITCDNVKAKFIWVDNKGVETTLLKFNSFSSSPRQIHKLRMGDHDHISCNAQAVTVLSAELPDTSIGFLFKNNSGTTIHTGLCSLNSSRSLSLSIQSEAEHDKQCVITSSVKSSPMIMVRDGKSETTSKANTLFKSQDDYFLRYSVVSLYKVTVNDFSTSRSGSSNSSSGNNNNNVGGSRIILLKGRSKQFTCKESPMIGGYMQVELEPGQFCKPLTITDKKQNSVCGLQHINHLILHLNSIAGYEAITSILESKHKDDTIKVPKELRTKLYSDIPFISFSALKKHPPTFSFGQPTPAFGGLGAPSTFQHGGFERSPFDASGFGTAFGGGAGFGPGFGTTGFGGGFGPRGVNTLGTDRGANIFGGPSTFSFGGQAGATNTTTTSGFGNTPLFPPYETLDSNSSVPLALSSVTAWPNFNDKSVEELRHQYYATGINPFANHVPQGASSFSGNTGFAFNPAYSSATNGGFSFNPTSTTTLGGGPQPANSSGTSGFSFNTTSFGAQTTSTQTPSLFGTAGVVPPQSFGARSSLFGSAPTSNTSSSLFGGSTAPPAPSGTGPFGSSSTSPNTGSGLFGASSTVSSNTGSGLFGTSATTSLFGGSAPASSKTSLFGDPAPTSSNTGLSLGGTSVPASLSTGSGLFGTSALASSNKTSLFGGPAPTSSNTGLNLFGAAVPASSSTAGLSLFGTTVPASSSTAGLSLSGTSVPASTSSNTGLSLSGTTVPASSSTAGLSLFGTSPASKGNTLGSLFVSSSDEVKLTDERIPESNISPQPPKVKKAPAVEQESSPSTKPLTLVGEQPPTSPKTVPSYSAPTFGSTTAFGGTQKSVFGGTKAAIPPTTPSSIFGSASKATFGANLPSGFVFNPTSSITIPPEILSTSSSRTAPTLAEKWKCPCCENINNDTSRLCDLCQIPRKTLNPAK